MMDARTHRRHGFSLLELSIVLAIISLIAGAGMSMASGALKAADRITTQERLNTIKLALDSFSRTYGYVPCPANRTLRPVDPNFGVEARAGNNCVASAPGIINNGQGWFGAVPVRTLGLPDNYAGDAWGSKLSYAVSSFTKGDPSSASTQPGSLQVLYGNRTSNYNESSQRAGGTFSAVANNGAGAARLTVSSAPSINPIVYVAGSVYKGSYRATYIDGTHIDLVGSTYSATDSGSFSFQQPGPGVSYVVVSHGPDGRGAYPLNSTTIPATKLCNTSATANSSPPPCTSNAVTSCIDIENCNDDVVFFDTAYNDGAQATQYFDDYIVWGSNDLQRTPTVPTLYTACPIATGACENWCAACAVNYPGGGATAPPPTIISNPVLYRKVITSDSTTCSAACFWGGMTGGTTYIKTP